MVGRHSSLDLLAVSTTSLTVGARAAGLRFRLKRKLGRGAFSEVWLAWDRLWEQDVAVKFLPLCLRQDAVFLEQFPQAVARNRQLTQPAIARVFGFFRDHEVLGVELEYIEGWSLAALKVDRPEKRYGSEELAPWLRQLCPALDAAHKQGLVHQALTPASLLLNAREQVKLSDFGIAHHVKRALARQGVAFPENLAFLSPQQATGGEPGPLDDVYSLGATLFDLLTGTPPFRTGDVLAQVRELPPPSMSQRLGELGIQDSVPDAWEQVVAACLAKDASRRPRSAGQLLEDLEHPPAAKRSVSPGVVPGVAAARPAPSVPVAGPGAPPVAVGGGPGQKRAQTPVVKPATLPAIPSRVGRSVPIPRGPSSRSGAASPGRRRRLLVLLVLLAALGVAVAVCFHHGLK